MYIFQIPSLNKISNDCTIGVIDCSGSMQPNWVWLASQWNTFIPIDSSKIITFDTDVKIPSSNRLDADICKHGGKGTNITAGFMEVDKQLALFPTGSNVTILFISDGQDNHISTLSARMSELKGNDGSKRVNFICIGVGPGFPTFISMKLREKYHNGDETLPAIFLIEHISEKAYAIKFEAIKPFLAVGQQRVVKPPVCVFPWREYSSKPFERTWVMTESETVEIDGVPMDVHEHHLNIKGINELFRSWNQMINLESMNEGEKVGVRAKKTLALMDNIIEELKTGKGIDVFAKVQDIKFEPFLQKFQFTLNKRNFERTVWYYEDVKKIAAGNTAGGLSDFEAAKRIGLGTIVGKYAQRTFALKNITPVEFEAIKEEFKELLKHNPVAVKTNTCALRSLLLEKGLNIAIDLITNQLELFECFPLHGHPIRINRIEQGQLNAQFADIRFFSELSVVELNDIVTEQGGILNVPLKNGKLETANAVIPLYTSEDKDLLPFIDSRLYKLLVSFNLLNETDQLSDQAYICTLIGLFGHILKRSTLENELIDKIITTFNLIRSSVPAGDLFKNEPSNKLDDLINQVGLDKKPSQAPPLKIILNALSLFKQSLISSDTCRVLIRHLLASEFHTAIKANSIKLNEVFSHSLIQKTYEEPVEQIVIKKIRSQFPKIRTLGDLTRHIGNEILNQSINSDFDIQFIVSRLEKLTNSHSPLQAIDNLAKLFHFAEFTREELEVTFLVAFKSTSDNSFDFSDEFVIATARNDIKQKIKKVISDELNIANTDSKKPKQESKSLKKSITEKPKNVPRKIIDSGIYKLVYPILLNEFREIFKQIHSEVIPETRNEMQKFCKKNGICYKSIKFNELTLLPVRVCAAKNCPFFLRTCERLDNHLNVWGVQLPKDFHLIVKANRKKTTKEIYEVLATGHFTKCGDKLIPFDPLQFGKTETEILQYIEHLQTAYNSIFRK